MTRKNFLELWQASWDGDSWIASWKAAVCDLSAAQAAWKPAPDRHSIWQNVNHVIFWRNHTIAVSEGRPKPTKEDTERLNFAEPERADESSWRQTLADVEKSHRQIQAIIADDSKSLDRIKYHLAHDAYHLGQIMQLRALQGLKPLL